MYGKSSVPPKYENFCCPICGSKDYNQMTQHNGVYGPGGHSWKTHCVCLGCSVQFQDAEKFTKAKKS